MRVEPGSAHIVLVEDDPNDVYLVERSLQESGLRYELTRYPDGDSALQALDGDTDLRPDLFLLDLNLPRVDGISVLKAIRQRPRLVGIPVGILTSSESLADRHRVELIGADRYIHKPVLLDEFLREVGGAVRALLELQIHRGGTENT
jgi:CheY-like chemotaxis protein